MNLPVKSVFFIFIIAALVAGACSSSDSGNEDSALTDAPADTSDAERPQGQARPAEETTTTEQTTTTQQTTTTERTISISATQVSAGFSHSCATLQDGEVWCWGRNFEGQLGDGTGKNSSVPVQVSGITTATQVSAGGDHSCALLENGTVWCWGRNFEGQLGNGTIISSSVPVQVAGITSAAFQYTATQVSAGGDHSCALLGNGRVWCWGSGWRSQLGNRIETKRSRPVKISGIGIATQVSAGGDHSCALLEGKGGVKCWGRNFDGQLGDDTEKISGTRTATQVSAGGDHYCATLLRSGTVCWGLNREGQLGNRSQIDSSRPVSVRSITTLSQVSAGFSHSCAVSGERTIGTISLPGDGTIWCWGLNRSGQLGNRSQLDSSRPVKVSGITTATQVSAGGDHSCALLENGEVKCWGWNFEGQLGNGTIISSSVPVQVSGIPVE